MAVASGTMKSTLNPNAPLFVPAAFQRVEDFSPEWWELVQTTSWFRDYWFHEHQQQEIMFDAYNQYMDSSADVFYDGDANDHDDIANLLPKSLDLGILEDETLSRKIGSNSEADELFRNLSTKSPKNIGINPPYKQWEKPSQSFSPRAVTRRVIHQPR